MITALVIFALSHPTSVRCPRGWHNYDGARPTGATTCAPDLTGPDWIPGQRDRSVQPPERLPLRVYCFGGRHPEVDWDGLGTSCRK